MRKRRSRQPRLVCKYQHRQLLRPICHVSYVAQCRLVFCHLSSCVMSGGLSCLLFYVMLQYLVSSRPITCMLVMCCTSCLLVRSDVVPLVPTATASSRSLPPGVQTYKPGLGVSFFFFLFSREISAKTGPEVRATPLIFVCATRLS